VVAQARLDGLFGQRWKWETVHSVMKCLFGDAIRSRSWRLQRREPMLKALVYTNSPLAAAYCHFIFATEQISCILAAKSTC